MGGQFEYITLSPSHVGALRERYGSILRLKENVNMMVKTFGNYSDAGTQLCSCMHRLTQSLEMYNESQADPAIRTMSEVIAGFRNTLKDHFVEVKETIVAPLQRFVKDDIAKAEEASKNAGHWLDQYKRCMDSYAAQNKKKPTHEGDERDIHLLNTHWQAVYHDFMFERAMTLVERKKMPEVATMFLMFVQLATVSFKQCYFEAEQAREVTQTLQIGLPDATASINDFGRISELQGTSLDKAHEDYSSRLFIAFPGSQGLTHEGWLWKKGSGITKAWQRRYFICRDYALSYVHGAEDQNAPIGTLNLLLTTVKPIPDPERRFTFTIVSQQKTYTLQALTEWDLQKWMAVIRNNI
jgi:hypothetical protein